MEDLCPGATVGTSQRQKQRKKFSDVCAKSHGRAEVEWRLREALCDATAWHSRTVGTAYHRHKGWREEEDHNRGAGLLTDMSRVSAAFPFRRRIFFPGSCLSIGNRTSVRAGDGKTETSILLTRIKGWALGAVVGTLSPYCSAQVSVWCRCRPCQAAGDGIGRLTFYVLP